jgi:hypothetical protein
MVLAPIVIDLGIILMFLVAFALCLLARQVVHALFQIGQSAVGWIPWLGSRISGDLHRIEQRITNQLGQVAVSLQHRVGAMWHSLASLMQTITDKIEANAGLIWQIAHYLPGLATTAQLVDAIRELRRGNHATATATRTNTRVIHDVTRVTTHERDRVNTITTRVQAIPADVLLPGALGGLRGRVRAAEDEIASLWNRVKVSPRTAVEGVAVGALAFALGRLGMTWARCSNVGKFGRRACGMDANLLESLLADTLLVVGTLSLVTFAEEMQGVTEVAVRPITSFWRAS